MEAREYIDALRGGRWVILGCLLLGLLVGGLIGLFQQPAYTASAEVFLKYRAPGAVTADVTRDLGQLARQDAVEVAALAKADGVVNAAAGRAGLSADELRPNITSFARAGTSIVNVSVNADERDTAVAAVDAVAGELQQVYEDESPALKEASPTATLTLSGASTVHDSTLSKAFLLGIGAITGLAAGLAGAFLRSALTTRSGADAVRSGLTDGASDARPASVPATQR